MNAAVNVLGEVCKVIGAIVLVILLGWVIFAFVDSLSQPRLAFAGDVPRLDDGDEKKALPAPAALSKEMTDLAKSVSESVPWPKQEAS